MAQEIPTKSVSCLFCDYENTNESKFLKHAKSHQHEHNFRIPCMFCSAELKTSQIYKSHKKVCKGLQHKEKSEVVEVTVQQHERFIWQCQNCPDKVEISEEESFENFDKITTHLKSHSIKKELVTCPICDKTYGLYNSFTKHIGVHKVMEQFNIKDFDTVQIPTEQIETFDTISDNDSETESNVEGDISENALELDDVPVVHEVWFHNYKDQVIYLLNLRTIKYMTNQQVLNVCCNDKK